MNPIKQFYRANYGKILLGLGSVSFIAMGMDKFAARGGDRRTSELKLHLLELSGGWIGSFFGQQLFRHKIQKPSYKLVYRTIVIVHVWYMRAELWDCIASGWSYPLADRDKRFLSVINFLQSKLDCLTFHVKRFLSVINFLDIAQSLQDKMRFYKVSLFKLFAFADSVDL